MSDFENVARGSGWTEEGGVIFRMAGEDMKTATNWGEAVKMDQFSKPLVLRNYQEIVSSPQVQAKFFAEIGERVAMNMKPGERLDQFMARNVQVDGKPFSQASHLSKLEIASGEWDLDEAPAEVRTQLAQGSMSLRAIQPEYDASKFILGFEYMVGELRASGVQIEAVQAPAARKHSEHMVKSVIQSELSM